MLRRLKHHINVKISKLLDHMILATLGLFVVSLSLVLIYILTENSFWLGLIWLAGLFYAVGYFSDALKYSNIVNQLDQDSLNGSIWLSKAYLFH